LHHPPTLRIVPQLQREFPNLRIKLRADAGFATPLLYEFCEFYGIQYAIGIGNNSRLQGEAQRLQRRLAKRYRRTAVPQRSFSSFRYHAHPGLNSGASATRLNMLRPEPTCVFWSPTCQVAALPFFLSITIVGSTVACPGFSLFNGTWFYGTVAATSLEYKLSTFAVFIAVTT